VPNPSRAGGGAQGVTVLQCRKRDSFSKKLPVSPSKNIRCGKALRKKTYRSFSLRKRMKGRRHERKETEAHLCQNAFSSRATRRNFPNLYLWHHHFLA
jgi:hypothetical protein